MVQGIMGLKGKSERLVAAQFLLILALIVPSARFAVNLPGAILLGVGLMVGLRAITVMKLGAFNIRPDVKKGAVLVKEGPYKIIRHPMYTSVLLSTAGIACFNGGLLRVSLWLLLALLLVYKARYEESLLKAQFPEYKAYMTGTKALIPYIY
jgi:protein-S-isoprenylcysteine O-methyltransferase Ste14